MLRARVKESVYQIIFKINIKLFSKKKRENNKNCYFFSR